MKSLWNFTDLLFNFTTHRQVIWLLFKVTAHLPRCLRFSGISRHGKYSQQHLCHWEKLIPFQFTPRMKTAITAIQTFFGFRLSFFSLYKAAQCIFKSTTVTAATKKLLISQYTVPSNSTVTLRLQRYWHEAESWKDTALMLRNRCMPPEKTQHVQSFTIQTNDEYVCRPDVAPNTIHPLTSSTHFHTFNFAFFITKDWKKMEPSSRCDPYSSPTIPLITHSVIFGYNTDTLVTNYRFISFLCVFATFSCLLHVTSEAMTETAKTGDANDPRCVYCRYPLWQSATPSVWSSAESLSFKNSHFYSHLYIIPMFFSPPPASVLFPTTIIQRTAYCAWV